MNWDAIADRSIQDVPPGREEALAVLRAPGAELPAVLTAAYRVRRHFHGNRVKIHVLLNAMSGLCSEDCGFCSQSREASGPVEKHRLLPVDAMVEAARKAKEAKAWKFCIVTSTRGPNERQLEAVCEAVRRIKAEVGIRVCASLGILEDGQAERLKASGLDRFNHNLETSERRFPEICSTHAYDDRVRTVRAAQSAGLEACSGGIIGMGESDEDVVEMAFNARALGATSVPVNFFDPRPGTSLAGCPPPSPAKCLLALCLFRFVNPSRDIRAAGGREKNLRSLQALALYPCNSIFTGGYLTTPGNRPNEDHQMIHDLGFVIEEDGSS
ncbi:MAG: biotin synthase BioB [Planctomycetes bacterium]|nr:biotin synthase BioB [Planctomycetota bacterium]